MEIAVEAGVDPQLALRHGELLQVAVESEGARPVQPDGRQITVHREGRHVLGGCREERGGTFICLFVFRFLVMVSGGTGCTGYLR